jgi:hypothetical protein
VLGESKVVLHEDVWGSGCIDLHILGLGTSWRSVVSFTPRWVGPGTGMDDVERSKIVPLPGLEIRPLGRPALNQSLYRLCYPGSIRVMKKLNF